MALPEITVPGTLPAVLIDGHGIEPLPVYASVPMWTGHSRSRRAYTRNAYTATVSWFLSEGQAVAFNEWYEQTLQAGVLGFSIQIAAIGVGLKWWAARFVENAPPYTAEPQPTPRGVEWRISARLLLTEGPLDEGPEAIPATATNVIALVGSAGLSTDTSATASTSVVLLARFGFVSGTATTTVPLEAGWVYDPCADYAVQPDSGGLFSTGAALAPQPQTGGTYDSCRVLT